MRKTAIFFAVPLLGVLGCATTTQTTTKPPAIAQYITKQEPLVADGTAIPDPTLRDASEERVGVDELGPTVILKTWTWHPHGADPYIVWIACRGQGTQRVCGLAAASHAPPGTGMVKMGAFTHLGFSNPHLAFEHDKVQLTGDDQRGAWTQELTVGEDGALKMGKRQYPQRP